MLSQQAPRQPRLIGWATRRYAAAAEDFPPRQGEDSAQILRSFRTRDLLFALPEQVTANTINS